MNGRNLALAGLVGAAFLALGGSALAEGAPASPITPAGNADANQRKAYLYNATKWSFGPASDLYRDLAGGDPAQVGVAGPIAARVYLAYNLANLHRLAEAQSSLDVAEALFAQQQAQMTPIEERLIQVNLLIARSQVVGGLAAQSSGEARNQAFSSAVALAARAEQLAAAPLREGGPANTTPVVGEAVALDPARTLAFNLSRVHGELGAIVGRPMSNAEKLAIVEARASYARAAALLAMGDAGGAAAANGAGQRGLTRVPPDMATWLRALLDDQAATLQAISGDPAAAERTLKRAIGTVQDSHGLSRPEAYLWRRLGGLQSARGDAAEALQSQERSFAILVDQTDGAQPTREEVSPYQALLAPGAVSGDPAVVAKFFEVSSVAVETATAATIANAATRLALGDSVSAVAIRDLQEARARLERATARQAKINDPASGATADQRQTADEEQREARKAVEEAVAEAVQDAGSRAGAVISPRVRLPELQSVLRPDEAYVRFVFVDDGPGYVILVRKGDARVARLATTEAETARKVADLRLSTQVTDQGLVPGFRLTKSAEIYQDLFSGIDATLADTRRLVIEPSGPLFSLPFAALLVRPADDAVKARFIASRGVDYTGAPWLARDKTLELSVGSGAFVRLRQVKASTAPKPIFAFADPTPSPEAAQAALQVGAMRESRGLTLISNGPTSSRAACATEARGILGFEPLPDSLAEATSAAQAYGSDTSAVVSGQAFTDEAVKSRTDLKSYRTLLFATHAALPNQAQCWPDPFLITTKGAGPLSDGVLDTTEIATLDLNANLVVLSACDTAASDTGGQALGGLAQSFFFAGSRGVLVSHWAVNSKATAALITGLLAANARGSVADQSLAEAERSLMDTPQLSHPYYWAAFSLVGGVVQ